MAQSFKSFSRIEVQQAFALAHRAGHNPDMPLEARRTFREIAKLIWDAAGEPQDYKMAKPAIDSMCDLLKRAERKRVY